MNLIFSFLGMVVCTAALIYMVVKKPDKKQKKAGASKNTLQLLPERYYDDELDAFVIEKDMTGYRYMDLIEIKSQDLNNLSEDEVYFNMAKLSRFFKRYEIDIKLIALNFPSDMSKQKKYYMKKRESTKNVRYQKWIDRKIEQFEWLELNQTTREYYCKIFADNEEKLVLQRNQMIDDLGIGRDGLLLEIEKMKKIEILNKCNNKNSMILKRENND